MAPAGATAQTIASMSAAYPVDQTAGVEREWASMVEGEHNRVSEDWMGQPVETLRDLLRPDLRVVCVGINPSPVSVDAGHYYQGRLGLRFWQRLRRARLLPLDAPPGREDDAAFAAGVGFTDIVKRPTARAGGIGSDELAHGRAVLIEKLDAARPDLVVFTFKKTAEVMLGSFTGNGFVPGQTLGGSDVFVMPGPYESADSAARTIATLADRPGR